MSVKTVCGQQSNSRPPEHEAELLISKWWNSEDAGVVSQRTPRQIPSTSPLCVISHHTTSQHYTVTWNNGTKNLRNEVELSSHLIAAIRKHTGARNSCSKHAQRSEPLNAVTKRFQRPSWSEASGARTSRRYGSVDASMWFRNINTHNRSDLSSGM
jgi:hypothetical protein